MASGEVASGKIGRLGSNIAVLVRRDNFAGTGGQDGIHKMTSSYYRWVIVAAGGLLGCVAIGAMFSLPVFLRPISLDTGWSITGISSAMTFSFLAMALGSIIWGNLSDRYGPRLVVLTGSTVLGIALALAIAAWRYRSFPPAWEWRR